MCHKEFFCSCYYHTPLPIYSSFSNSMQRPAITTLPPEKGVTSLGYPISGTPEKSPPAGSSPPHHMLLAVSPAERPLAQSQERCSEVFAVRKLTASPTRCAALRQLGKGHLSAPTLVCPVLEQNAEQQQSF